MRNHLTEAHAAKSLENRQYDDPSDAAFAFDPEHQDHEDQNESSLTAHHHELRNHVGEKDLAGRHTSHPASVQQALHSLDDQGRWCKRDRQEEDDTTDARQVILKKRIVGILLRFSLYVRICYYIIIIIRSLRLYIVLRSVRSLSA